MTRLAHLRANLRARISAARSRANWRSTFYGGTAPELIAEIDRTLLAREIAEGLAAIRGERRAAHQIQQGA